MAQQWGAPIVGKSVVHCVAGGHDGMFKYPYVETLAAKMKTSFEQIGQQAHGKVQQQPAKRAVGVANGSGSVQEEVVQEPAAR
jgi:hypothetical protein